MSTTTPRPFRAALTAALLLAAAPASAAGPQDQAAAVALFQEGRKLAVAGDYEHACPKFAEAQRLFPTAGTLLSLGDCYEKAGRLASAWGAFKQAEIAARNGGDVERQEEGARRALKLEGSLSKLTITVAGLPGAGIEVRRDGNLVGEGQWGTAVPVDAGNHVIEVTAPGRQKWTTKVQVVPGGASVAVSVPELPPEKAQGSPAQGSAWGAQRIAGVTIGGAGVVGLVIGAVFGARAISKKNASNDGHCDAANFCDPVGKGLRAEGMRAGDASTIAVIAGGIGAAAGIVLLVTAPSGPSKPKTTGVVLSLGPGDVHLMTRW